MVDLTEYERRGDLNAPFELTKKHERAQTESERIREAVRCNVARLTWEEYSAGEPCPGCGLPYRDEEPWDSKGTMYFTEEERARYDAEQVRFKEKHGDCHAMRHSIEGSLTTHCGKCCPPPPLSPRQIEKIGRILGPPKQSHELMRWRLRLYCGHMVEKQAHYTHKTLHSAFTVSTPCPECGLDPATIVDAEAIGLVEEPPGAAKPARDASPRRTIRARKPTRAELGAKVRELEAEIERLRRS
ncbi:hypothetical protein [Actinomadura harenae]|uniref:hypothetical protein n=1 Tax=Actinomadura harenae TaxID=2483351 RepID=UPI0011C43C1F|nr:hypothetical protein [Actinomadura harenae]